MLMKEQKKFKRNCMKNMLTLVLHCADYVLLVTGLWGRLWVGYQRVKSLILFQLGDKPDKPERETQSKTLQRNTGFAWKRLEVKSILTSTRETGDCVNIQSFKTQKPSSTIRHELQMEPNALRLWQVVIVTQIDRLLTCLVISLGFSSCYMGPDAGLSGYVSATTVIIIIFD